MKKWIIAAILILIVVGFIPVTTTVDYKINAPFFNVYQQLSSPQKWLIWQSELKAEPHKEIIETDSSEMGFRINTPTRSFSVAKAGLGGFDITKTLGNKTYSCNYFITPDNKANKTIALAKCKTILWNYLWAVIFPANNKPILAELKDYIENPVLYYGFIIKKEQTQGKLIAVKRGLFVKADAYRECSRLLQQLDDFIVKNNLKVTDPLQMQYLAVKTDSIRIMLGLPVNKKLAFDDVEYMTMPQGKVLAGYYKGAYEERTKLYKAMQMYMNDNYIHPMITPFERFKSNKLPASDSAMVDMQVIIPYM